MERSRKESIANRLLRNNRTIWIVAAIGQSVGEIVHWNLEVNYINPSWGRVIQFLSSVISGGAFGCIAQKEEDSKLARDAVGVSWRLALIWILLHGLVGSILPVPTEVYSPPVLLYHLVILAIAFAVVYLFRALACKQVKVSGQAISSLIFGVGVLIAAMALADDEVSKSLKDIVSKFLKRAFLYDRSGDSA